MDPQTLIDNAARLATQAQGLAKDAAELANQTTQVAVPAAAAGGGEFMFYLTVFALACFVGYYVVWRVTPALHSPLMAVTNAISSVIIVGALIAAGPAGFTASKVLGFVAVVLASVNIFGGFLVTQRMLAMFKKKQK
ncbi:MAG: NAD(P) transhydrogenase subunit alpha [Rhodospirillales bacterium]|nr:NAD(P) transhydrogenase subunit alpha [Rhodospirillales bacterium]